DGRSVWRAVVGQAALPVGWQQLRLFSDRIDIICESERDNIGLEPVDHGAGLFARTAIGNVDRHILTGGRLPVNCELDVVILVKLAGRIVRGIEYGLG